MTMERYVSANEQRDEGLTALLLRWKIGVALFIAVVVAVNALLGTVLLELFSVFSITLYGIVVIGRRILQLRFAHRSNRRQRLLVRTPLVEAVAAQHPEVADAARALLRQDTQFPAFKAALCDLLGDVYDLRELSKIEEIDEAVRFNLSPAFVREQWIIHQWRRLMHASFAYAPFVGLVIPTYRTTKLELQRLIESLEDQTYPHIYVAIVLNEDDPELKSFTYKLIRKFGGEKYVRFVEPRKGKRNAMTMGFADFLDDPNPVKYVFNVDSDSRLEPDAIANAVRVMESDPQIACVTGDIRVSNTSVNLLTTLTAQRFFFAFYVERAAQNLFDSVTCMSGAFMGIRTSFLRHNLRGWSEQVFLGRLCNYGDDRHIATLALKQGYKSSFCPDSISHTDVPHEMRVWRRQQTRWARSAWRETLVTLPWLHRLPLWIVFETAYLMLFPFILWGILISIGLRALAFGPQLLVPYLIVVLIVNFAFNSIPGIVANRDFRFLLGPLYLFYQFVYLQPIRVYALLTLENTGWGTK